LNNIISRKIELGTAQLGFTYGIANRNRKIKLRDVNKILDKAKNSNIKFFDTAKVYGKSEEFLGKSKIKKSNITSKIQINLKLKKIENHINSMTNDSLKKLKIKKLYGLLVHNSECLLTNKGQKIYNTLNQLKRDGKIKKLGISAYSINQVRTIIKKFQIDLVSFPLNIFDNRLLKSGLLKILKKKKIKVHIRSVFLQGLLLMKSERRPKKFNKWNSIFKKWDNLVKDSNKTPLFLCLLFVLKNPHIDKVTIGVDSINQLNEIINTIKIIKKNPKIKFNFKYQSRLSDPRKW